MAGSVRPALRFLSAADVEAAMPPIAERLRLAELTMVALARPGAADLPAKIGVHPRPPGSFAHAMPAHLRAPGEGATNDLLGIKWIAGFAGNRTAGLPALHALLVVNDPGTGVPLAILEAGPITAQRTAAISGLAIRQFAPEVTERPLRVALIGAGAQARSHLPVVGHLLPGADVVVFDRHADRTEALVALGESTPGIGRAFASSSARAATDGADVVLTMASFTTPEKRQVMTSEWLLPSALVVPVDYATYCSAEIARSADLFLVDERGQFVANREEGQFDDYPDPHATIGEAILAGTPRPEGRVVVTHLGLGLADVVFGDAILRTATERGLGTELPT
jgi:ornithine cyclodeaminase/alanine dehydrogenase